MKYLYAVEWLVPGDKKYEHFGAYVYRFVARKQIRKYGLNTLGQKARIVRFVRQA